MKNIITASIHFSFKGENHSPSITIELDQYLEGGISLPDFCSLIAKENKFDLYSYEYEMMQAQNIIFSNAQGLVADFIHEGLLNFEAFHATFHENKIFDELQNIAKEKMQVGNLEQQPDLKEALMHAYRLGKNIRNQE
jgi:hypothetical protein